MRPAPLAAAVALAALAAPSALVTPGAFAQEDPVRRPPDNPLAPRAQDPWAGTWTDGQLELVLERRGAGYVGTVSLQGQRFPLAAAAQDVRQDARLTGTFEAQGARFELELVREGDGATLATGGATYRLRRVGPRNPLAPGGPAAGGPAAGGPAAGAPGAGGPAAGVPDDWQRWRHPLGYELRYPPGWQLQETDYGLVLAPPDLARDPMGQPLEAILLNSVPAQGVTRPDDPRAVQYVEMTLGQVFPFLRRTGQVVVREGPRPVAELTFEGTNPAGKAFKALSLVALLGDQAVLGLLLAEPPRFAQREGVVRQVFSSAGLGQAQRDPRLVGTWRYEHHTFSRDFSSTSVTTMTLAADGRCSRGGQLMAGATHRDGGGAETGRTTVDSGDVNQDVGTWAAAGDTLILRWGDGSVQEWKYEITPSNLLLKGSGEPRLYDRVN